MGKKKGEKKSKLYISVDDKVFGEVDLPKYYFEEPKRVYEEYPIIILPENRLKTLKEFYLNYKDYESFMRVVLTEDEFDCWQYQTQRIYKMFKEKEDEN